jgi:transcription elongation factor SPT5
MPLPAAQEAEEDRLLDELEDELSASSGEDEDEEAAPAAKKPKAKRKPKEAKPKKKRSAYIDDAAEEDAEGGAGGRKLKRSRFIDDIAEVDDDEDEDEEDGEGMDDLIDDRGEAPDAADLAEVRQAMRDAERRVADEEDINPEAMQRYIAERYGGARGAAYTAGDDGGDGAAGGAVAQQALMPTARDANLWVVRCVDGAEREIVCCLLQKCYDYAARGQPLLIKAAFAKDALKGYLYVEAFKESHVREALKGMRSIFHSKPPRLVPLGEMVGAIAVRRAESRALAPGAWVRLRTGLYKGDLARVTDVDASGGRATVKLVPRLDLAAMAARRPEDARANFGKAPKVRPPARAFNPEEARGARLDVSQQRDRATGELFWSLGGAQRFAGGYLVKGVSLKSVVPETSLPPLDELQRFNAAAADDGGAGGAAPGRPGDLAALVAGLAGEGGGEELAAAAGRGRFAKGDRVVVTEGELKGLRGRVAHVTEGGEVHVRLAQDGPLGADFADLVPFPPRELAKLFAEGEHVKVAHGQHAGETGMVLRVDGGVCHVLTDATRQEIRAFGRDLEEAVAVASSLDS